MERNRSWLGLLHGRRRWTERRRNRCCANSVLPRPPSLFLHWFGGGRGESRGRSEGGVSSRGEGTGVVEMGRELGGVCCGGGVIFPIHGEGERRGERAHIQTGRVWFGFWVGREWREREDFGWGYFLPCLVIAFNLLFFLSFLFLLYYFTPFFFIFLLTKLSNGPQNFTNFLSCQSKSFKFSIYKIFNIK